MHGSSATLGGPRDGEQLGWGETVCLSSLPSPPLPIRWPSLRRGGQAAAWRQRQRCWKTFCPLQTLPTLFWHRHVSSLWGLVVGWVGGAWLLLLWLLFAAG